MGIFQDITIYWCGKEYKLPADQVMQAISRIEQHISIIDLQPDNDGVPRPPLVRMARAYSSLLQMLGARVSPEEVYSELFADQGANITDVILGLQTLMVPPAHMQAKAHKGNVLSDKEKPDPLSRKRTKRQ